MEPCITSDVLNFTRKRPDTHRDQINAVGNQCGVWKLTGSTGHRRQEQRRGLPSLLVRMPVSLPVLGNEDNDANSISHKHLPHCSEGYAVHLQEEHLSLETAY